MTAFAYKSFDSAGRVVRGRREAASETQVRDGLIAENLTPLSITPVPTLLGANNGFAIPEAAAAAFAADVARFLKSGLSLGQTLQIIETTSENPRTARLAGQVHADLMAGRPLSAALGVVPGQTGRFLQALAKAGEATGKLADILEGGAGALRSSSALKQRLTTLLVYPAFVFVMAIGAVMLFAFGVLPALEPAFQSVSATLPPTTAAVLNGGKFLRFVAPYMAMIALAGGAVLALVPAAREACMRGLYFLMLTPLGMGILADAVFASLAKRLSIAIRAGVPIATAFRVSIEAIGVDPIRRSLEAQEERLREGAKISDAFRNTPHAPEMLIGLAKVGETSADLPKVLAEAGDTLSARAQEKTERFLAILTPAIVLGIGLMVGGIVLVVFQGLMSISDLVAL